MWLFNSLSMNTCDTQLVSFDIPQILPLYNTHCPLSLDVLENFHALSHCFNCHFYYRITY